MDIEQKILGLIDDANYVEAAAVYEGNKGLQLTPYASIQLARSYHCLSDFEAALGILEKIPIDRYASA